MSLPGIFQRTLPSTQEINYNNCLMKGIIDFHTHAFPDELADRAMKLLTDEGGVRPHLDATESYGALPAEKLRSTSGK